MCICLLKRIVGARNTLAEKVRLRDASSLLSTMPKCKQNINIHIEDNLPNYNDLRFVFSLPLFYDLINSKEIFTNNSSNSSYIILGNLFQLAWL